MQCALFYCDLQKQKIQHGAFLLSTLVAHLTELSKVFQALCFDFAQVKASAKLCINMLSDAAVKSELKLIAKRLIVNQGNLERWMVWLTRVCQVAWRFGRVPKISKLIVRIHKKGDGSDRTNRRGISLLSLPGRVHSKTG